MQKRLKTGRMFVAGRLLWLSLALSSCLLPQNDEPLPVIPPARNRPPRIFFTAPERSFKFSIGMNCKPPTVQAGVEDADLQDLIRIKWFTYEGNGTDMPTQSFDRATLPESAEARRSPPLEPPPTVFNQGLLTRTGVARQLEVVVSDGEFSADGQGNLISLPRRVDGPDGGLIDNITYIDRYVWVVDTVNEPCPPP
mgnify:CR=1 FL=1